MADFVNGLRAFKPNDNAPSFVKANITINKSELTEWLKSQSDSIRISLLENKDGKYYMKVNDFTPQQKDQMQGKEEEKKRIVTQDEKDDLPF